MKIEYESHVTGEKSIGIQYFIEVEPNTWVIDSIICDLSECWNASNQLATPDEDKSKLYADLGQLTLEGYRQELEKEEDISDKYMTLEILENHLKAKYPNEQIEII